MLDKTATVLLTGARGMVGSAVLRLLRSLDFQKILAPSRKDLDLENQEQVDRYFAQHRPEYVFMIASKVGGIAANEADPVGFLSTNARITLNLFDACFEHGTRKNLFLGSSCVYPRDCPQPMKEEYLLTGPLEPTNEGYALAKIIGLRLAQYYQKQHGMLTLSVMPCNIYGTGDSFDLQSSHVLSALVRRFVDATDQSIPNVTLWGTGSARREFIHVDDVAQALLFLMEHFDSPELINLGTGEDIRIYDLAMLIADLVDYKGEIDWDTSRPDGMPRKCLDVSKLNGLGFTPVVGLKEGIKRTINEYRQLKSKIAT